MNLTINGQTKDMEPAATVADLLDTLGLAGRPVLVEHNGTALFHREFAATRLADGDHLEIIELAAGG